MEPLHELLEVTERQALEFFVLGLQDVSESDVDRRELLYNASVLAHYSQVSTQASVGMPSPASLSDVFDHYVCDDTTRHDSATLEVAGTQCLLLGGFFEDQMRRRHNIRWYAELGAGFFGRAAVQERSQRKAVLFDAMAKRFEPWRQRYARLSRELRDQAYLLRPLPPSASM
jgi:hypothetical protein